jgi:hypothetical protein
VRSVWETSAGNLSVSFCDRPLTFWAPSLRTIFCTLIFLSQLHELWSDTSGMWCNYQRPAFGGTLDRRCHFKHVSLKQSRFYHCQTSTAHRWRIKVGDSVATISIKNFPIGLPVMYHYFPDTPRTTDCRNICGLPLPVSNRHWTSPTLRYCQQDKVLPTLTMSLCEAHNWLWN